MHSPSHQQMIQIGSKRSIISWFILFMIVSYILYSSNLILFKNEHRNCSPHLEDTSTKHIHLTNASSTTIGRQEKETEWLEEDIEEKNVELRSSSPPPVLSKRQDTELKHIVFGIAASSKLWDTRKEYIKIWWKPNVTRGVVWLDGKVNTNSDEEGLPQILISEDTSDFKFTNPHGVRSALRISRIVTETFKLGMKDVRWFVMGDDDTVFVVNNLVRVLSKYDHRHFYYIGSSSESHLQNIYFSYSMAYGGGGFAISYSLAKELAKIHDRCIKRYPSLYGSDERIQACMAEIGVPLTKELGFHQYDVHGSLLGLLGAHPVTPLVTLHHLDIVEPIFPRMDRVQSLRHLMKSIKMDSASIMQQSICYDRSRKWSISVSWGYVVQVIKGEISPRELEMPSRTFLNWFKKSDDKGYSFNTRPVSSYSCQKPFMFYLNKSRYDRASKKIVGTYDREKSRSSFCLWEMESPGKVDSIVVIKKPDPFRWQKSPRRDCCRVLPSHRRSTMYIWVDNCRDGEGAEL